MRKFVVLILLTLVLSGCMAPQVPGQNKSPPTNEIPSGNNPPQENGALPEDDCLGLTAEKVQAACGSGPLKLDIGPIQNGYECTFYATDPEGVDKPDLGTELKLTYYTDGDDVFEIRKTYKEIGGENIVGDIKDGFYLLLPTHLALDRKGWIIEFFRKTGSLTTMLFGTDIDYEAMAKDPALACSFEEVWNLHASIYHENLTEEQMTEIKETVKENPGLEGTTEGGTGEASSVCCKLFVAEVNGEVDIKKAGKDNYQPVEKGTEIEVGDEIVTGDGSSVVIAKVCTDSPDLASIALVSENTLWRLESIEGGMANVYIDPGVAQVSVKQLEQFETDFQVSTPRLTCATRG